MRKLLLIVMIMLNSRSVWAGLVIQADYMMLSDTLSVTSTTGSDASTSFYNLDTMFTVNNSKSIAVGWAVIGLTTSSKVASTTVDQSSSDMGPVVKWSIGKEGLYSLTAAYGIICTGSYKITGSTTETWNGSSTFAQFAVQPKISDYFRVSFSFNYYSASYSTKVISNTQTNVSYTKSLLFPMIGLTYQW